MCAEAGSIPARFSPKSAAKTGADPSNWPRIPQEIVKAAKRGIGARMGRDIRRPRRGCGGFGTG
jgi:hypothetical protein